MKTSCENEKKYLAYSLLKNRHSRQIHELKTIKAGWPSPYGSEMPAQRGGYSITRAQASVRLARNPGRGGDESHQFKIP